MKATTLVLPRPVWTHHEEHEEHEVEGKNDFPDALRGFSRMPPDFTCTPNDPLQDSAHSLLHVLHALHGALS